VQNYWTDHNVTNHRRFQSRKGSLDYFDWRNDQYVGYIDLMPVSGRDHEVVLDYGCGPGHDLVGFAEYGNARRIVGIDVSPSSLEEARARLTLHPGPVEFHLADPREARLPLEDGSVDYVHCSGVLHHILDPAPVIREFYRVLRPGGRGRIMVYFQNSIWYHLYVAYQLRCLNPEYVGLPQTEAFRRSTDGPGCPVSRCYTVESACALLESLGLPCIFVGSSISIFEMSLVPARFSAIMDERLDREHRTFLSNLTFDSQGVPRHRGIVAGIDGVFEFTRP
jgi:SAM-dependent methyltransferase